MLHPLTSAGRRRVEELDEVVVEAGAGVAAAGVDLADDDAGERRRARPAGQEQRGEGETASRRIPVHWRLQSGEGSRAPPVVPGPRAGADKCFAFRPARATPSVTASVQSARAPQASGRYRTRAGEQRALRAQPLPVLGPAPPARGDQPISAMPIRRGKARYSDVRHRPRRLAPQRRLDARARRPSRRRQRSGVDPTRTRPHGVYPAHVGRPAWRVVLHVQVRVLGRAT
jgi:hypothetical protein